MDDTVPLSDVILVLKHQRVSISAVDVSIHRYTLAKGGIIEERTFTDPVGKHELRYLSRKFDIAIFLFWHTEMLDIKPEDQIN